MENADADPLSSLHQTERYSQPLQNKNVNIKVEQTKNNGTGSIKRQQTFQNIGKESNLITKKIKSSGKLVINCKLI